MLWFSVWLVLVVGTLVGAFFLGRHVLRAGRALLGEVGRAGELASDLAARVSDLEGAAPEHPVRPTDLTDLDAARGRWDEAGRVRAARRERRRRRYQATYQRWRSLSR